MTLGSLQYIKKVYSINKNLEEFYKKDQSLIKIK